jgi:transposase
LSGFGLISLHARSLFANCVSNELNPLWTAHPHIARTILNLFFYSRESDSLKNLSLAT